MDERRVVLYQPVDHSLFINDIENEEDGPTATAQRTATSSHRSPVKREELEQTTMTTTTTTTTSTTTNSTFTQCRMTQTRCRRDPDRDPPTRLTPDSDDVQITHMHSPRKRGPQDSEVEISYVHLSRKRSSITPSTSSSAISAPSTSTNTPTTTRTTNSFSSSRAISKRSHQGGQRSSSGQTTKYLVCETTRTEITILDSDGDEGTRSRAKRNR